VRIALHHASSEMVTQKTTKAKLKPFPLDGPCPCGSGSFYRDCCAGKKFRFKIDKHGNIIRQLEIHPRLKPELERALQEFKEMFGRKPGRGDPIFFSQHLTGEEDFWQHAQTVGKIAGLREELIFAWRRSGLIVGQHSREIMPDADYDEWTSAIDEYFLLKKDGYDPFFVFTYLSGEEYDKYKRLIKLLDHIIIVIGFAHTNPKRLRDSSEYFRYLLIGRAIRSLRTIREMFNTRYDDDCLAIARAVYETYLRIKLLRCAPASSERFEAMLAHEIGAFPTKLKKDGRPKYGFCVDPETGQEFAVIIANSETLKVSDFSLDTRLYYDLYPLLSGYVHPELVRHAMASIEASRADLPYTGDSVLSIVLVITVCTLLLREIAECPFLRKLTKRDLLHVAKQLDEALVELITTETLLLRGSVPLSIYALFEINLARQNSADIFRDN
jgi:hypothetical protein